MSNSRGGSGGDSGAEGGEAGDRPGGSGGGGPCGEACENGLVCHAELGCARTCAGDVVIASPTELTRFAARGCEVLEGSLTIRSPTLVDVDALAAPSTLRVVSGDLVLDQNPKLASLAELHSAGALTDDEYASAKARVLAGE